MTGVSFVGLPKSGNNLKGILIIPLEFSRITRLKILLTTLGSGYRFPRVDTSPFLPHPILPWALKAGSMRRGS